MPPPVSDDPYSGIVARLYPSAEIKTVARLSGGVSADVYRLELNLVDGSSTSLVLRAHGASYTGQPVNLEYQLLQALYQHGLPVPEPLLADTSGKLLAEPFLVLTYVDGTSDIPTATDSDYIEAMADMLANIHSVPITSLPVLPERIDPLSEVLDYLPKTHEWLDLRAYLRSLSDTRYLKSPKLLHGDFWPMNILWHEDAIAAVLDWEDASFGDPLSDVACCTLELRYKFGKDRAQRFIQAYARHREVDNERLALWQVNVAAAAQRFMNAWGLAPAIEAHMHREALASIREAGALLLGETSS